MISSTRALAVPKATPTSILPRRRSPKLLIAASLIGFLSLMIVTLTHIGTYNVSLAVLSVQQEMQTAVSSSTHSTATSPKRVPIVASNGNASRALQRISQLDCGQYTSQTECDTWASSACSSASMTEVLNAYGHHYRITDVLNVESSLGEITPQLGLVEDSGVQHTLDQFGFTTEWGESRWTLDQLIAIANTGFPVIVSFPPPLWGHILVLRGGDASTVSLADSSTLHITVYSRSTFLYYWRGFAAIALPYGPSSYQTLARQDAQQVGIRPDLFSRQMNQESGFQPFVVSPAGAIGMAQFLPETAADIGLNPWNPTASLRAAARYMANKLASYHGDYAKALASYSAGSDAVAIAIQANGSTWLAHLPAETQAYVHDILG